MVYGHSTYCHFGSCPSCHAKTPQQAHQGTLSHIFSQFDLKMVAHPAAEKLWNFSPKTLGKSKTSVTNTSVQV